MVDWKPQKLNLGNKKCINICSQFWNAHPQNLDHKSFVAGPSDLWKVNPFPKISAVYILWYIL